jgi:hypothetical protein
MIAIDNAPSPNETMGFVSVAWTEIEVHCEACGSESEYQAREVTILQAVALQWIAVLIDFPTRCYSWFSPYETRADEGGSGEVEMASQAEMNAFGILGMSLGQSALALMKAKNLITSSELEVMLEGLLTQLETTFDPHDETIQFARKYAEQLKISLLRDSRLWRPSWQTI